MRDDNLTHEQLMIRHRNTKSSLFALIMSSVLWVQRDLRQAEMENGWSNAVSFIGLKVLVAVGFYLPFYFIFYYIDKRRSIKRS